ncbi:MAG: hypothetical protein V7632_1092 [Bradyrhizobium sp.]|jgi:Ca2+-binding RTX toxin-like protein
MFGDFYNGVAVQGFIDVSGNFAVIDVADSAATSVSGVDVAAGEVVGTWSDNSFRTHGFIMVNGVTATFDAPGAYSTSVVGVSAGGLVVGNFQDYANHDHGFIDAGGSITAFDFAGATDTTINFISDSGEFVGNYADSLGNIHGFVDIGGVAADGTIYGYYNDAAGQHGFVGPTAVIPPPPPPGTIVTSASSYTLSPTDHNLTHIGSSDFTGIGNNLDNVLIGGAGDDDLIGLDGNDTLTGGAGNDMLVFTTAIVGGNNVDDITDFTTHADRIVLDHTIFAGLPTGVLADAAFSSGLETADSRIVYDPSTGALSYDADGSGAGAAIPFATLANHPADFSAHDVLIV